MNAKFLKKIFYNRKARRGFKPSKIPAKKRNFNLRRKINYNYSNRTQTYGPNSVVANITGRLNWNMEENHFNFAELITGVVQTEEYKKYADDFEFIKIIGLGITVYPNDNLNNIPTYLDVDWGGQNMTAVDIVTSDRAKIVFNDLKKQKTFYFRPPDVITHDSFNPRKFNLIPNFEYSSVYLSIQQAGGLFHGRMDLRLAFRGPLTKETQLNIEPEYKSRIIKKYLEEEEKEEKKEKGQGKKL
jgi:hypothetical protein